MQTTRRLYSTAKYRHTSFPSLQSGTSVPEAVRYYSSSKEQHKNEQVESTSNHDLTDDQHGGQDRRQKG